MAALLGLVGRKGRFWIRVKKDMCISCGACSTYCEMGIDVRAYAQRNESFRRLSCVGCGICAHVCPRGVLRLENTR
jgi:Pyruvate/2-oxoacid:ferredoxin oxidoreductase delta subunit